MPRKRWSDAVVAMHVLPLLTAFLIFSGISLVGAQDSYNSAPARNPEWIKNSTVYQVYLRDFSAEGKFANLENDLLRLKNLGVNCLLLLPVQPSGTPAPGEMPDPFCVKDFASVSLEYGTKDGLKSLEDQVHYNDMKLMLSWVIDRASSETPLLKDHPDWFMIQSTQSLPPVISFDYRSRQARDYMKAQLIFWVKEYSLDGFDLIGSDKVPEDFLKEIKEALAAVKPSCVIITAQKSTNAHLYHDDQFYRSVSAAIFAFMPEMKFSSILNEDAEHGSAWPWPLRAVESFGVARSSVSLGEAFAPASVLQFCLDGVPLMNAGQEILEHRQNSPVQKNAIDWVGGLKKNAEARKFYKKLITFRNKHASLSRGQKFIVPAAEAPSVFVLAASYRGDAVLAAVNFSSAPANASVQVPDIFWSSGGKLKLQSIFGAGVLSQKDRSEVRLKLPAWGYEIWNLE